MKNLFTLLLFATSFSVFAQKEADVLKEANKLIENKKYESAYKKLDTFDPANTKPAVVILKAEIVEEYFVTSIMHQMFALKDLEPGEDVMDYRGTDGQFSMQTFAVHKVLDALIATNPKNCSLYAALSHFYYEAYTHYDGKWLKTDDELFGLIELNGKKAVEGKCATYKTYDDLGFVALSQKRYKEAIAYYQEAIKLNKEYATPYYNMAYAYLYLDDRQNAITYAGEAFRLYKDTTYKADAARLAGTAYNELDDTANAIKWYEKANETDPGNYYTLRPLLTLYVATGNAGANTTREEFFKAGPLNDDTYDALQHIYDGDKVPELMTFYKQKLEASKNDNEICGTLNFYMALLYIDTDNKTAHDYLLKAKEHFTKVVEPDNQVFQIIDEGLEYTKG